MYITAYSAFLQLLSRRSSMTADKPDSSPGCPNWRITVAKTPWTFKHFMLPIQLNVFRSRMPPALDFVVRAIISEVPSGVVGVIWFIFWAFLISETPSLHPRISDKEKSYILDSLKDENNENSQAKTVPWKSIATSMPFWAIFVGQFGYLWGIYTVLTELPTYLKTVIHFDVKQSASLTALPYVGKFLSTMLFAVIGDFCRSRKYMSTGTTRKVFTSIGNIIPAAFFVAIPHVGCNKIGAVVMFILATTFHGGGNAGVVINHADISPRYAGTLFGLTNTASTAAGILAPYFVGYITNGNSTLKTWGIVFYVCAAIHVASNIFYVIFASGEEQVWNRDKNSSTKEKSNTSFDNAAFDPE